MKLDIDCVRSVLLELERFPIGNYSVGSFSESIKKYEEENVLYALAKLTEAQYINASYVRTEDGRPHFMDGIFDITFQGHQFLDKIRDNKIWAKTKSIANDVGSFAFDVIAKVATNVIMGLITGQLTA